MSINAKDCEHWRCPMPDCSWINEVGDSYKATKGIPDNECLNCQHCVADIAPELGRWNPWCSGWEYASDTAGRLEP